MLIYVLFYLVFTVVGQPYNFTLQYKAVKDYSADLYYLMDVSRSMYDDKFSLTGLAGSLVDAS